MGNIIHDVKRIDLNGDSVYSSDEEFHNYMQYDALGKIKYIIYPDGEQINYAYNKAQLFCKSDSIKRAYFSYLK